MRLKSNFLVIFMLVLVGLYFTGCEKDENDLTTPVEDGPGEPVNDIDGNTYQTVWIGGQNWMAENLKTKTYKDGTPIKLVADNNEWAEDTTGAMCWYENDEQMYAETYGALYNWHAVNTGKLCPDGWHVPTDEEWKELEMYLGMSHEQADSSGWRGSNEGSKLAGSRELWIDNIIEYDPEFGSSGFKALAAGIRNIAGTYTGIGYDGGAWWASTAYDEIFVWERFLGNYKTKVARFYVFKENGYSIRCLKNN